MLLYKVNFCANWTIVNNKLLCKQTVLHISEPKKNKSIDNQSDSCYFIMVNSTKNINHLTCDHMTREVLATSINDFQ